MLSNTLQIIFEERKSIQFQLSLSLQLLLLLPLAVMAFNSPKACKGRSMVCYTTLKVMSSGFALFLPELTSLTCYPRNCASVDAYKIMGRRMLFSLMLLSIQSDILPDLRHDLLSSQMYVYSQPQIFHCSRLQFLYCGDLNEYSP